MSLSKDTSEFSNTGLAQYVSSHWARLGDLKDFADETFQHKDLPETIQERFDKLVEVGVLQHVERDPYTEHWTWRVNKRVLAYLDRYESSPNGPLTPCCLYNGFENLRDGGFECKVCGSEFERDEFVEA